MEFEQSLREGLILAPMTTLGIGGPARYFAEVTTAGGLIEGVSWARANSLPLFFLGGGSNIVVADSGFPGLVLRVSIAGLETRFDGDDVVVTAGSGEVWDTLVRRCVDQNWAGFECLSGIPGRVGATPIQNVGAYGQETSETLASVGTLDLSTGKLLDLSAGECEFGYRTSRFKTRDRDKFVIVRVTYRLRVGGTAAVRYPEPQRYLDDRGVNNPSLSDVRQAVLTIRGRKAMVIDPSDVDSRSVGSFFVNPTLTREEFEDVKSRAMKLTGGEGDEMPSFPMSDGRVKLSAAWLIELAGIKRGYTHGNVGTSTKHALAIVNRGGGTSREIVELKELIQQRVLGEFGLALVPEPVFVGFDQ
jgi:UDP-N-acetylmuramate dehydrogenase